MKKILLFFSLLPFMLFGQHYVLDNSFGNNGIVITDKNNDDNTFKSLIELNDNKLLALTYDYSYSTNNPYQLLKYMPSGDLDINFGVNGFFELPYNQDIFINDILLQNDEKILLLGNKDIYPLNLFLNRVLSNGEIDLTFGNNGFVEMPGFVYKKGIIQDDGKIILTGISKINDEYYGKTLKLLPNGELDVTFGENGIVTTYLNGIFFNTKNILVSNNNIYIHFQIGLHNLMEYNDYIVKYSLTGELDLNFGSNGILNTHASDENFSSALNIKENGKLILAIKNEVSYFLTQFEPSGNLDVSFGTNGIATNDYDFSNYIYGHGINKIIITNDDKLLIYGSLSYDLNGEDAFKPFLTNHYLNGEVNFDFSIVEESFFANMDLILQENNNILIVGESFWFEEFQDIVLTRYTDNILYTNEHSLQKFNIYPNPVTNFLTIDQNISSNVFLKYSINDILGKTILEGKLDVSNSKIDISSINNGIYFIKVNNQSSKFVKK